MQTVVAEKHRDPTAREGFQGGINPREGPSHGSLSSSTRGSRKQRRQCNADTHVVF